MNTTLISCVLFALIAGPTKPASISAEKWINGLTLRPGDDRALVILFFDHRRTAELGDHVRRLNKIAKRRDVLVIGVSRMKEAEIRKVLADSRPRFAIGVRSVADKTFSVKRFPTVLLIKEGKRHEIDDFDRLDDFLGASPAAQAIPPEELRVEELQSNFEASKDYELLEVLRVRMDSREFVDYCDRIELEKGEHALVWRSHIGYQRHLADDSTPEKQSNTSPAREALREARRQKLSPYSEIVEMLGTRKEWSSDELLDIYADHFTDEPEDLLYRYELGSAIGHTANPEYVEPLLDMLDAETDPLIRFRIAGAIDDINDEHPIADRRVIRRLEQSLAAEENIRWARPMLEFTINNIKNPSDE